MQKMATILVAWTQTTQVNLTWTQTTQVNSTWTQTTRTQTSQVNSTWTQIAQTLGFVLVLIVGTSSAAHARNSLPAKLTARPSARTSTGENRLSPRLITARLRTAMGRRLWTWVAAGGAATTFAAGVALGLSATADAANWKNRCNDLEGAQCNVLSRTSKNKNLAAKAIFGAAGALAVTSAVLYFVEGYSRERFDVDNKGSRFPRIMPLIGGTYGGALRLPF